MQPGFANPFDWSNDKGARWARHVDFLEATMAPADAPLLEALQLTEPSRIADLACGAGGTTRRVAEGAPEGSAVSGFDLSPELVRLAFAVWGPAEDNHWLRTVRDVVTELVELPTVAPDAPGPMRYAEIEKLVHLLEGAGFEALEITDWRGSFRLGGGLPPAEAAARALAAFSSFGPALEAAGALAEAERRLSARLEAGPSTLEARIRVVSGSRT